LALTRLLGVGANLWQVGPGPVGLPRLCTGLFALLLLSANGVGKLVGLKGVLARHRIAKLTGVQVSIRAFIPAELHGRAI